MVVENTDTTLIKYTHDGADLLFEHDDTDDVQIRYLYGPGIDHILESEVSGSVYYQHFADALGSVTLITDSAGDTVKTITYDSFGNIVDESGSADAEEISYTGREREKEFGLYYYRARYYDPLTGRFMARDPLGFAAGDVNLYRYVGNNPVNWRDAFGLFGEGFNKGGDYLGHSDFSGNELFDYNKEDYLWRWSNPWNLFSTWRHFRNVSDVERELAVAITDCDKEKFESLMHQGQDYFTHYSGGYRWYPTYFVNIYIYDLPGHVEAGQLPDRDNEAWTRAEAWSERWLNIWLLMNDPR